MFEDHWPTQVWVWTLLLLVNAGPYPLKILISTNSHACLPHDDMKSIQLSCDIPQCFSFVVWIYKVIQNLINLYFSGLFRKYCNLSYSLNEFPYWIYWGDIGSQNHIGFKYTTQQNIICTLHHVSIVQSKVSSHSQLSPFCPPPPTHIYLSRWLSPYSCLCLCVIYVVCVYICVSINTCVICFFA